MTSLQAALPAPYYVDDGHWAREREQVLHREWFCAGRVPDLGEGPALAVLDVAGESILVTRDGDGGLRAFYNVCRHRGSQVVPVDPDAEPPAPCRAQSLRCPYHSWTYDLGGRLLRAPHTEDIEDFDPDGFGLHPVGVDTWGGFLFLHLTPQAGPPALREALGPAVGRVARYPLESLVVGDRREYDVRANYKVVLENYNECYHCGPVHPELCRLVPAFAGGGSALDWEGGVPHREGARTFTATGTTTRAVLPGLSGEERTRHKADLVFPNLLLSASPDHVAAFVLRPRAVDRTDVECTLLFAADEVHAEGFDPSDAGELWDLVNRQDWAVCEGVQRGMSSRSYRHGWFAPMEDESLDIRRWLLPLLEARQ